MINKNKREKVNIKVLIIVFLVIAAIGTSLFTARSVRRSFLSKMDFEAGQAAFEQKDWPEAFKKLRGYLSRDPDNVEILKKYAKAALSIRPLNIEAITGAVAAYRRVIQLAPDDEIAYEKLAMLYAGIGNFEELAYIARMRIDVPDDRNAPLWLADALFHLHKTDEAKEVLDRFMKDLEALEDKHPEYVQACAMMSSFILEDNTIEAKAKALAMLDKAVEYSPESVEPLVTRSQFYREVISSMDLALVDLEAADVMDTENPKIHLLLGVEWIFHGELGLAAKKLEIAESLPQEILEKYFFDIDKWTVTKFLFASQLAIQNKAATEAVSLVDEVLDVLKEKGHRIRVLPTAIMIYVGANRVSDANECLDEYVDTIYTQQGQSERRQDLATLQAQVARAEGRPYAVIDILQPAVMNNASRPDLWRLLAEAYSRTDQSRRAISALIQYRRFRPKDKEMTMQLAKEYIKLQDWNRAFEAARLAEPLDPKDIIIRLLRIETSINIAASQTYTKNTDRLEELSDELAELRKENPKRVEIRILQAMIAEHLNKKPDEVEAELKDAIEQCEEPLRAEMQLVRYYYRTKRMAEAISVCEATCERNPKVAEPWLSLSGFHVAKEDYDSARSCLEQGLKNTIDQWDKRSLSMRLAMLEFLYNTDDGATGTRLLTEMASQDEQEVRARLLLLSIPEIREDRAKAEKLITELGKAEGESGLFWRLHQASLLLSSDDWRSKQQEITELLQYCINSDPQWSSPVLLLVRMYNKLEDDTHVEDTCRQALVRNPSATDVADTLMSLLEKQRRFYDAGQVLQQIETNPRVVSAWNVRIALRGGDFSRAIDELKFRVNNDDKDANSRILLARLVYWQNKDAKEAFGYLKEAEEIMPGSMALIAAKVSIRRAEKQTEEAQQILDDYVVDSNNFGAYAMRAAYLASEGKFERAEEDYKKLITFADQGTAGYELLSNFYARQNKLDKAIVTLEEGLNAYPGDLTLKRRLMKTLLLQGPTQDRKRAIEILATLEKEFSQDPELMKYRAMQMLEEATPQSLKEAREKLEHVIKLEPTAVNAHLTLIGLTMQAGEYETARDCAIRALGYNPNSLELKLARGKAELAIGNTPMATELARQVLREESNNTGALVLLLDTAFSVSIEDRGLLMEEVVRFARLMLEEDPNHAEVQDIIITAAMRSNDQTLLGGVRTMIESELDKEPANEILLLLRTRVLVSMKLPQIAIPELEAFVKTTEGNQSVPAIVTLSDLHRINGDLDQAQQRIEQAELIEPNNQLVIHARLLLLVARERFDEIEGISSAYLSAEEQNPTTLVVAASILTSMDSMALKQEGLKLFEQAANIAPTLLSARLGLASTLYQTGDMQRAKQVYQELLVEYPDNIQALNDLAWILQEHDQQFDAALELVNRGLSASRDDKDRLHLLDTKGTILSNMPNRLTEARNDFKTLVDKSPDDTRQKAKALLQLGRICAKLNDLDKAKQHMKNALEIDQKINVLTPKERSEITRILQ